MLELVATAVHCCVARSRSLQRYFSNKQPRGKTTGNRKLNNQWSNGKFIPYPCGLWVNKTLDNPNLAYQMTITDPGYDTNDPAVLTPSNVKNKLSCFLSFSKESCRLELSVLSPNLSAVSRQSHFGTSTPFRVAGVPSIIFAKCLTQISHEFQAKKILAVSI